MRYDVPQGFETLFPGVAVRLATAERRHRAQDLLTDAERRRQAGFAVAERRLHFALGRLALREVAAAKLGVEAAVVEIAVGADGAPEVAGLYASISHGGTGDSAVGFAAVAAVAVGVDVEPIRARRADLWRRILHSDEREVLDALGGPSDRAHTLLWSMKEAVLKGQRTGLRAGARSVRLSLDAAGGDAGSARARSERSGAWTLRYTRRGDLWLVVAVAADG